MNAEASKDMFAPSKGPGSDSDKDKALMQLEAMFSIYKGATGYSHLTGLVIKEAIQWREKPHAQIVTLIAGLTPEHLRRLWDMSREAFEVAYETRNDLTQYHAAMRKATDLEEVRQRLVGLREAVTNEKLSYPEEGGVKVHKVQ